MNKTINLLLLDVNGYCEQTLSWVLRVNGKEFFLDNILQPHTKIQLPFYLGECVISYFWEFALSSSSQRYPGWFLILSLCMVVQDPLKHLMLKWSILSFQIYSIPNPIDFFISKVQQTVWYTAVYKARDASNAPMY